MIKTIELILGLPPMNQMDLAAPAMRGCFLEQPDLRPFTARPNEIPLDEMNPPSGTLSGPRLEWAGSRWSWISTTSTKPTRILSTASSGTPPGATTSPIPRSPVPTMMMMMMMNHD